MRQKRAAQQSLFDPEPFHHPVADALEAISAWLDAYLELLDTLPDNRCSTDRKLTSKLCSRCKS